MRSQEFQIKFKFKQIKSWKELRKNINGGSRNLAKIETSN